MKTILTLMTFLGVTLVSQTTLAQNFPADPSLSKIISDIKKDPRAKEMMTSYGYDPTHIDKGTYRFAKKGELKDYFYIKWYSRSDKAYKVSLNKNYMDERHFSMFLTTPKDSKGVYHRIYFKVSYHRRTPQDFEDTKWNYGWLVLDPRENESFGLPKISDDKRKQMMMDYLSANFNSDPEFKSEYNTIRNIVQIDSIMAYSHSVRYFKPMGANKFLWTLTLRAEYVHDYTDDGGVEQTRRSHLTIPFNVVYEDGSYQVVNTYYEKNYFDSYAPGREAMYQAGLTKGVDYEDNPVWLGTFGELGFDPIMGKQVKKEQPVGSRSFIESRFKEMEAALKTLDSGDEKLIREKLIQVVDPANAESIVQSYIDLVKDYEKKLCTLKVNNTSTKIPYSYKIGGDVLPSMRFGMSISRERASTKEQKKRYKAAGMSNSVLKSTSRGSEYGKISNKSYDVTFKIQQVGDNWYIMDKADFTEAPVRF